MCVCVCVSVYTVCVSIHLCVSLSACVYLSLSASPHRWVPALKNIFLLGNKRKQIPPDHLEAFFSGVAVVMTNQLREMTLDSINDYLHVFCPVKVRRSPNQWRMFSIMLF